MTRTKPRRKWRFQRPAVPVWYNSVWAAVWTLGAMVIFFNVFRYEVPEVRDTRKTSQVTLLSQPDEWLKRNDPRMLLEKEGFAAQVPEYLLERRKVQFASAGLPLPELRKSAVKMPELKAVEAKTDFKFHNRGASGGIFHPRTLVLSGSGKVLELNGLPRPEGKVNNMLISIRDGGLGSVRPEILVSSGDPECDRQLAALLKKSKITPEAGPVEVIWANNQEETAL